MCCAATHACEAAPNLPTHFDCRCAQGIALASDPSCKVLRAAYPLTPPTHLYPHHSPNHTQGIALASDPSYKVLRAAYPWVARRLLTDNSPELRDTLLNLLYKDKEGVGDIPLDPNASGSSRSATGGSGTTDGELHPPNYQAVTTLDPDSQALTLST